MPPDNAISIVVVRDKTAGFALSGVVRSPEIAICSIDKQPQVLGIES